jgi:hypothetical protein
VLRIVWVLCMRSMIVTVPRVLYHSFVASERNSPDLAMRLVLNGARPAIHPWETRTTARHTDSTGGLWAVAVDWAHRADGTAVPASVTLTSLGGAFGEATAEVEPLAVTRAVVESVPWGEVLWGSRRAAARDHDENCEAGAAFTEAPRTSRAHDTLLRRVGDLYRQLGGSANPTIALDVAARLETEGIHRRDGSALTDTDSGRATVRRWISSARKRGYTERKASK